MVFVVNIKDLELRYFCNGFDVPYKLREGGELNIRPVLVKDYPYYEIAKNILELPKNETNDINVIKMSYLEYLFNIININETYRGFFLKICELCFGYEHIGIVEHNKKHCIALCDEEEIIKYIITPKEFDEISKIILNQNDAHYDGRYVNPEVRELMEQYYKVKYSNSRTPTLEEKKAYVTSRTGIDINTINEMTYRYFDLVYGSSVNSEFYIAQKIIQGSYKYDVKEDIKHPLFEPKKDPYAEIFEDTSILGEKGISGADKLNAQNAKMMLEN